MGSVTNLQNQHEEGDINIVALWLKKDPTRWTAGALGGFTAGLIALVVAMVLSTMGGYEFLLPTKFPAIPFLGAEATTLGMHLNAILLGLAVQSVLSIFLGVIYAHFTSTNNFKALLGAGFTWGIFSWIFIFNLFIQSFPAVHAMEISRGGALFICLAYGFSLVTVGTFDRMLRK